jgi:hypothetical protein
MSIQHWARLNTDVPLREIVSREKDSALSQVGAREPLRRRGQNEAQKSTKTMFFGAIFRRFL